MKRPGLVPCLIVAAFASPSSLRAESPDAPEQTSPTPAEDGAPEEAPPEDEAPAEAPLAEEPLAEEPPKARPDTVIRQKRRDMFETAGSVQFIEEGLLEATEYDDPQSVLSQVPGVYARTEDGYGLRPNIGIRGVTSERSQKVTLMEDGILFGPAPYSAPAAYYFPLMTRMVGLDILKGPAAILHGPNTIGGAIDLLTRKIPRDLEAGVDLALGSAAAFDHLTFKGHGHVGTAWSWGGALAEVVHLESDGFKQLDGPGRPNTGFSRTEAMLKLGAHTDRYAERSHRLELKLGLAREISHETYLGLSDADFAAAPHRRYAASALDRMQWERLQVELSHVFVNGAFDLATTAYWHAFDRAWRKVGRFRGGPSLEAILDDPESPSHSTFHRILTGAEDSLSTEETLMIGTNDRSFSVLGAQTIARHRFRTGAWKHKPTLGLRLHHDGIERLHTEDGYSMTDGRLERDQTERVTTTDNAADTLALASWLAYGVSGEGWTFTPGVRLEWIAGTLDSGGRSVESDDVVLLPGLGVHRELASDLGVFAGLYRGFSPVAPGQHKGTLPETSLNWELGLRWLDVESGSIAELVGFWNDYSNLVGTCTLSSGCADADIDRQFNGGEVTVVGLEVLAAHAFALGGGYRLPVRLAYTLTHGVFDTGFDSDNPQFGRVEAGDHLPYVPTHQLQVQVGVEDPTWGINAAFTLVDAMREEAGQGDAGRMTQAQRLLDVMAHVSLGAGLELYARAENLLMEERIASRRPYGARPNKPFAVQLGLKWGLGRDE